jgi:hypothetical protein
MDGIPEVRTLDQVICQILPLAVRDFRTLIMSRLQAEGAERLELLNALVLIGPTYVSLERESEGMAITESVQVREEIEVLRLVPEIYIHANEKSYIDIELEKLILPAMQICTLPSRQVSAFLQASTDARRSPFGRLIYFLSTDSISGRDTFRTADAQRSIAFALHVMAERRLDFGAWQWVSGVTDDHMALLALLHGLRIARANGLVSDETVSSVVNALEGPRR